MARNYVHLTEHLDYARKLAQRSPDGLILSVDALAAQQAGAQFLSTGTHVWLSDAVAPRFLSVFEAAATEGLAQIDWR
jgi:putative RNA 2'-phosphotransferase